MKKTKTILALVSALALLLVAACEQGLEPTPPDLGNFHDARTNQSYTNHVIQGEDYFPEINPLRGAGLEVNSDDPDALLVKIDFTEAVKYAKGQKQTLDILKGSVEENIKKAIIFQGVTWPSSENGINEYPELTYDVTAVDREIVYVKLPALNTYQQVRPYIKASEYKVSGQPIDTDGNLLGGESPYDDEYWNVFNIANGASQEGKHDKATAKGTFTLGAFSENTLDSMNDATYIYGAHYAGFNEDSLSSYTDKLKERFVLEKWNASAKTWESTSLSGQYTTTDGNRQGDFYFTIPYGENDYNKYRVVAVDLHKFETETIKGFKRRFAQYPGDSGPVTIKGGRKVVSEFVVRGSRHEKTHTIGVHPKLIPPATAVTIHTDAQVYTDEQAKNALLVLNLNTTKGGPLGNLGLKDLPADFNANFKLAYQTTTGNFNAGTAVFEFIGISKYELRQKPGTAADPDDGGIEQQLVLTLDPGYVWQDSRTVYILAREGIKFAGDDVKVGDNRKPEGSLGDANGTINIDGKYDWGYYGYFTATAKVNEE